MRVQHVLKPDDVVRWAKRPAHLYRVIHLHPDGLVTVEAIGEGWVHFRNVPIAELRLAPVDLEDLN